MRCEEVRPLLAELADGELREAGPVEEHLEGCAACSEELAAYRSLVAALGDLRDVLAEPSAGFLGRVLAEVPEHRARGRLSVDPRVAFSVGGAVVGATAIGLLWWRNARRTIASAPQEASLSS